MTRDIYFRTFKRDISVSYFRIYSTSSRHDDFRTAGEYIAFSFGAIKLLY